MQVVLDDQDINDLRKVVLPAAMASLADISTVSGGASSASVRAATIDNYQVI